ncbi:GntR family transcriptional regulator [Roseibium sp.]|uniref:GntR family transcriptional regulator n=1 Tax=Roseibium sp. TaxID=1936156 RepID=UPI003D0E7693
MSDSPEQTIVSAIVSAVSEQRLPPGAKLGEQELSEVFSCNRANVRRALATLAALRIVELRPNRGAFVSSPTPKEAKDVFQARRALERTIARQAALNVKPADIEELRRDVAEEHRAHADGNQPLALRLSREFHLKIARIAGNSVLEEFLRELTMRTTLIISLYSKDQNKSCAEDEHAVIVDTLEAGDAELLVQRMDEHLRHIEAGISFKTRKEPVSNLRNQLLA